MNKSTIKLDKIDGIYDIHAPIEPALNLLEKSLIAVLLTFLISFLLYYIWKFIYSNKAIAICKIKKLHKNHQTNKINPHDAVFELCKITKQGLKLKKLNNSTPFPDKIAARNKDWQVFLSNISKFRYQKKTPSNSEFDKLFLDCLFWLKVWP